MNSSYTLEHTCKCFKQKDLRIVVYNKVRPKNSFVFICLCGEDVFIVEIILLLQKMHASVIKITK